MEKRYGASGPQNGLEKIGKNKYELIYGFGKDREDDEIGWNYRQRFSAKPTVNEIKAIISAQIDADTDENILHGFVWNGLPVKLDTENQTNILGILVNLPLGGDSLFPMTFKLGDYPDGTPAFHEFTSAQEFGEFAQAATAHKQAAYAKGWREKSSINWEEYEIAKQ